MKFILVAVLASLTLSATPAAARQGGEPAPQGAASRWQADLDALVETLPRVHADAFHSTERDQWLDAAADLRRRLPEMSDHVAAIELGRLVGMLGDAHTMIGMGPAMKEWGYLPIAMGWLAEGPVIYGAPEGRADLLGARLVAVGGVPIEEAADRAASVRAHDNESGRRLAAIDGLTCIEVLHAVGLADTTDGATLRILDRSGVERDVRLERVARGSTRMTTIPGADDPRLPVSMRPRAEWQWMERLGGGVVYIRYDRCAEQPGRPLGAFFDGALAEIDEHGATRIVIDLRRNGGGNSALLRPLIQGLESRGRDKPRGWVTALIGPRTFSSACMNAVELRRIGAVLVGQPTSQRPNHFGEVKVFTLPGTGLPVQYATKHFRMVPGDPDALHPDMLVEPSIQDLLDARDAALEAASSPAEH